MKYYETTIANLQEMVRKQRSTIEQLSNSAAYYKNERNRYAQEYNYLVNENKQLLEENACYKQRVNELEDRLHISHSVDNLFQNSNVYRLCSSSRVDSSWIPASHRAPPLLQQRPPLLSLQLRSGEGIRCECPVRQALHPSSLSALHVHPQHLHQHHDHGAPSFQQEERKAAGDRKWSGRVDAFGVSYWRIEIGPSLGRVGGTRLDGEQKLCGDDQCSGGCSNALQVPRKPHGDG